MNLFLISIYIIHTYIHLDMNKRFLSVIVFGTALLSVQAQDGQGGITSAMLSQIQQSYQGTASDKALRNAIGNNDIRKLAQRLGGRDECSRPPG